MRHENFSRNERIFGKQRSMNLKLNTVKICALTNKKKSYTFEKKKKLCGVSNYHYIIITEKKTKSMHVDLNSADLRVTIYILILHDGMILSWIKVLHLLLSL